MQCLGSGEVEEPNAHLPAKLKSSKRTQNLPNGKKEKGKEDKSMLEGKESKHTQRHTQTQRGREGGKREMRGERVNERERERGSVGVVFRCGGGTWLAFVLLGCLSVWGSGEGDVWGCAGWLGRCAHDGWGCAHMMDGEVRVCLCSVSSFLYVVRNENEMKIRIILRIFSRKKQNE